jgi:hypothetical protein
VGEPLFNITHDDGRAQFYKGISFVSGSGNRSPNATLSAVASNKKFGTAVSAGKLNGDAFEDVALGAPGNATISGAVYLFTANSDAYLKEVNEYGNESTGAMELT